MQTTQKTRIAAIIIQGGKLLLQKGIGYDELRTPGGKIKAGETHEACLHRELMEELNVQVQDIVFFKTYEGVDFYKPEIPMIQHTYIVTIKGEPKAQAEIEKLIRFSREEYATKKYAMITMTQEELIPDIIAAKLF